MADFPKYLGNCPRNVAKDARYVVRSGANGPVIALSYSTREGEEYKLAASDHSELVRMVNNVKTSMAGQPNGAFYINEYNQVIVPVVGSSDYYLAGIYRKPLRFEFEGKTVSGEPVNHDGSPLQPGDDWVGPRVGIPYTLAAGGKDVYYETNPRPNVVKRVKLTKEVGEENAKLMAESIRSVKGFAGGRFYVNEFRSIFAPISDKGDWTFRYIGQLDPEKWFSPPAAESERKQSPVIFNKVILENFKGIGQRQEFELRPITLLFGPNSAGKSSVIHSLHYLRQALLHKDYDSSKSEAGGQFVDFDGFRNILFQRETSQREVSIGLRFNTDISDAIASERLRASTPEFGRNNSHSLIKPTRTCEFLLTIGRDQETKKPIARQVKISFDDEHFVTIKSSGSTDGVIVDSLNCFHPMLEKIGVPPHLPAAIARDTFDVHVRMLENLSGTSNVERMDTSSQVSFLAYVIATYAPFGLFPRKPFPHLAGQSDAIPDLQRDLSIDVDWDRLLEGVDLHDEAVVIRDHVEYTAEVISILITEPIRQLVESLQHFRYVGPIRDVPKRGDLSGRADNSSNWANGDAAWECLLAGNQNLAGEVSTWLAKGTLLDAKFEVGVEQYYEIDPHSISSIKSGASSVDDFPLRNRVVFIDGNQAKHSPHDVGFGMSQVVPVVVGSLAGNHQFVMIEQPELHIHPKLQANLGDLFVHAIRNGKQFLLETHSENLLLRLLRRLRTPTRNADLDQDLSLRPEDLQVLYVLPSGHQLNRVDGAMIVALPVNEEGEFLDEWPDGFFEERDVELFE